MHLFSFSLLVRSVCSTDPLNIRTVAQHTVWPPLLHTIALQLFTPTPLDHSPVIDVEPKSRLEEMKKIESDVKANGQGLTILVFKLYANFIGE